jgi:hypothetical protein
LAGTSHHYNSRFIAGRILERDVKIAVRFNFESNDAACESKLFILDPGAL